MFSTPYVKSVITEHLVDKIGSQQCLFRNGEGCLKCGCFRLKRVERKDSYFSN